MLKIDELNKILELKKYIDDFRKSHIAKENHPAFKMIRKMFGEELTQQADHQITAPIEHLAWTISLIERGLGFEITVGAIEILKRREERRKP